MKLKNVWNHHLPICLFIFNPLNHKNINSIKATKSRRNNQELVIVNKLPYLQLLIYPKNHVHLQQLPSWRNIYKQIIPNMCVYIYINNTTLLIILPTSTVVNGFIQLLVPDSSLAQCSSQSFHMMKPLQVHQISCLPFFFRQFFSGEFRPNIQPSGPWVSLVTLVISRVLTYNSTYRGGKSAVTLL